MILYEYNITYITSSSNVINVVINIVINIVLNHILFITLVSLAS